MSWYSKEQQTPFDTVQIEGLCFVDGDLRPSDIFPSTIHQKFPLVVFPSGMQFELREPEEVEEIALVRLLEGMDLPIRSTRDIAYSKAIAFAEQNGYRIRSIDDNKLEVWGNLDYELFLITYNNEEKVIENIELADNAFEETLL